MVLDAKKENLSSQITLTSNYVKIKVMPADAVINIDGNYYSDGNAYITVDEPHNLVVSHELYHDYEQTIYASSKEKLSYTNPKFILMMF